MSIKIFTISKIRGEMMKNIIENDEKYYRKWCKKGKK